MCVWGTWAGDVVGTRVGGRGDVDGDVWAGAGEETSPGSKRALPWPAKSM